MGRRVGDVIEGNEQAEEEEKVEKRVEAWSTRSIRCRPRRKRRIIIVGPPSPNRRLL